VAKVSVVGVGMRSHAGVAETMFRALADRGVAIQVISTSEIKISVLIDAAYTELAVRALHAAYGLDQVGEANPPHRPRFPFAGARPGTGRTTADRHPQRAAHPGPADG
jgi:hypothetical protein